MSETVDVHITDQELFSRMRRGDRAAFDNLYERYWMQVYSAAYKRLHDDDSAREITQDIFVQLWTRLQETEIANPGAYLMTAVRNNVYKWMHREQRFVPVPDLLLQAAHQADQADAGVLRREFMEKLENLISTLTEAQQQIFRLRFLDDLSTAEIAGKLRITRKTVQNQLGKSVAQLRSLWSFLGLAALLLLCP